MVLYVINLFFPNLYHSNHFEIWAYYLDLKLPNILDDRNQLPISLTTTNYKITVFWDY